MRKGYQGKKTKEEKSSSRLIMGRHCIEEILKHKPDCLKEVWSAKKESSDDPLIPMIHSAGIPIHYVTRDRLQRLVESDSHQSFVGEIYPRQHPTLEAFLKTSEDDSNLILLFLDSIYDPQNLGSILRSAECFGVDAVIWSKHRGCGMTPVVTKASVGASELLTLIPVTNLSDAIEQAKEFGVYVFSSELKAEATPLYKTEMPPRCGFVLGSEGSGVRPLVSKKCDQSIMIPMFGEVDSLNVSQACAVLLSQWRGRYC